MSKETQIRNEIAKAEETLRLYQEEGNFNWRHEEERLCYELHFLYEDLKKVRSQS